MKCRVSEKGQVTIPIRIRRKLGLKPGSTLEFEVQDGQIVGRKSTPDEDPVLAVTGISRLDDSVDDYLEAVRGSVE